LLESNPAEAPVKLVKSRRAAREQAFLALYQMDSAGNKLEEVLEDIRDRQSFTEDALAYAEKLVHGVIENRRDLEMAIIPLLGKNWQWTRIAKVDRAILKLAAYELFYVPELSPKISINEAVNFAKTYGTLEGAKFVNGLLGKLLTKSPKADWAPPTGAEEQEIPTAQINEPYEIALAPEEAEVDSQPQENEEAPFQIGKWTLTTPNPEDETQEP